MAASLALIFAAAIATSTSAAPAGPARTSTSGDSVARIRLAAEIEPIVLDYGLPHHPRVKGRGHVGAVARATVTWIPNRHVEVELGVLGRLPFALDIEDEAAALPIVSIAGRPFGDVLILRFGSLDPRHGYHPALLDESLFAYGRNVEETYNRSLLAEGRRDLGGDPFPPAEHGAQLIATADIARLEVFLDWQLLETIEHREKFNFGLLGSLATPIADFGLQFRLTHYGGELFTGEDPVRRNGLDPVRQPESAAVTVAVHPLDLGPVRLDLLGTFASGHMKQSPGGPEAWHFGFEAGADVHLFDLVRLGYRLWLPRAGDPGFISEDSDPMYAEGPSHRAGIELIQRFGGLEIDGRLDVIFPEGIEAVQYLAVTRVRYRIAGDFGIP